MNSDTRRVVLLVEEFGTSLGHISRLVPLADSFEQHGYRPVFISPMPSLARDLTKHHPVIEIPRSHRTIMNPRWPKPKDPAIGRSWAEKWADAYESPDQVGRMLREWYDLFEVLRPVAMVTDWAPSAALAARGRIPWVWLSDGWLMPPSLTCVHSTFARDPRKVVQPDAIERVLDTVNAGLTQVGERPLSHIDDLLKDTLRVLCTVPFLDPYRDQRSHGYFAPLTPLPEYRPARGRSFFCYLSPGYFRRFAKQYIGVIEQVCSSGARGKLYLRGLLSPSKKEFRSMGIERLDKAASYNVEIPNAAVIVHNGGHGTCLAAAYAGRPQLVLPVEQEQYESGHALASFGAARVLRLRRRVELEQIGATLSQMVADSAIRERAAALAGELRELSLVDPRTAILSFVAASSESDTLTRHRPKKGRSLGNRV